MITKRGTQTKSAVAIVALIVMSSQAIASSVAGKITQVRIDHDGKGMITFDTLITGSPACIHPTYRSSFAFDATKASGKAIMAVALTAKATGSTVAAYGTGACTTYGGAWAEDWGHGVSQ